MADDFRPVTPEIMRSLARADFDRKFFRELPPQSSASFDYNEEYARCAAQVSQFARNAPMRVDARKVQP